MNRPTHCVEIAILCFATVLHWLPVRSDAQPSRDSGFQSNGLGHDDQFLHHLTNVVGQTEQLGKIYLEADLAGISQRDRVHATETLVRARSLMTNLLAIVQEYDSTNRSCEVRIATLLQMGTLAGRLPGVAEMDLGNYVCMSLLTLSRISVAFSCLQCGQAKDLGVVKDQLAQIRGMLNDEYMAKLYVLLRRRSGLPSSDKIMAPRRQLLDLACGELSIDTDVSQPDTIDTMLKLGVAAYERGADTDAPPLLSTLDLPALVHDTLLGNKALEICEASLEDLLRKQTTTLPSEIAGKTAGARPDDLSVEAIQMRLRLSILGSIYVKTQGAALRRLVELRLGLSASVRARAKGVLR